MRLIMMTTLLLFSLMSRAEQGIVTAGGAPVAAADSATNSDVTAAIESAEVKADAVASTETKAEAAKTEAKAEVEVKDTRKESEIPLTLDAPKKAEADSHPFFKIILVISMMGAVGTGAFIFLRKHAKSNFASGKINQIKILTQHHLGPKKSLAIIRVAGESILIGITDQNINMIKSLSLLDDEVPEATPHHFAEVFGNNHEQNMPAMTEPQEEDEEFSIRGVKDAVSKKLKGMRSFQ